MASFTDVVELLGKYVRSKELTAFEAALGEARRAIAPGCLRFDAAGVTLNLISGRVTSVCLRRGGSVALPGALTWSSRRPDVHAQLGQPLRSNAGPHAHTGKLLTVDGHEHGGVRVNAEYGGDDLEEDELSGMAVMPGSSR
jgi:hypothetical protein